MTNTTKRNIQGSIICFLLSCLIGGIGVAVMMLREACKNKNVVCIDCSLESMTGNSREGDYMIATGKAFDSGEFEIMPKNYINHPSDVGFALIGNKILSALGYKELDVLHNINIRNTEGGVVSAPFGKWAEKGIVSLKCEADEGMQISNVAVTTISGTNIAATKRTNSLGIYYTFVMPEEDVNIIPSWM